MKNLYVADFETTTKEDDCRVWGYGIYNILEDRTKVGQDIIDFFRVLESLPDKSSVYFHNLKFDGEFLFYHLFNNGFKHTVKKNVEPFEFSTLITSLGAFYAMKIRFEDKTINIFDSLKIIPMPVKKISKAFGIEQLKGDIDYVLERPIGWKITEEEKRYIINDVEIVGKALLFFFEQQLEKMTQASNAFSDYKNIIGEKRFKKVFPILENDKELRQSYKGGFVYVNPKYQGKIIRDGIVLDVNSLYPSIMYYNKLPYGEPILYDGKYEDDKLYNVYIQTIRCSFELKKDHIPTIQLKKTLGFGATEYITSSEDVEVTMCLTSVDLELFLKHYDVYNLEYFRGWKFKSTDTMFKEYIDKWMEIKVQSVIDGNEGMKNLAKLMLNALYGKFGLNPKVKSKIPTFVNGFVKYELGEEVERDPIYIPVASFITSYARAITITGAQENFDRFIYADTDSLHLVGHEVPKNLRVHKTDLGAWDIEGKFTKGKFLRAKSYIEEFSISKEMYNLLKPDKQKKWKWNEEEQVYNEIEVTCAGLPARCHEQVSFDNFHSDATFKGKLQHKRVKGGVILKEIEFTIKV